MLLGSLLCLLAVTAWGFMFPIMTNALQFIDPFFFTTIRYGSAAIIFLILLLIIKGKNSLHLEERTLSLFFYGTFGFAGYGFLIFYGQQLAGPSGAIHAAMIQSLMPLIALLLQWITKNKRPQNYTFLCMFVALLGVMLVISKGNIHLLFGAASHFFNKYIYAMRRYLLDHLYKWRCSFSILVTTSIYDVNLFIRLNFTHRYCHYINLHTRSYCSVTTYNYERSF